MSEPDQETQLSPNAETMDLETAIRRKVLSKDRRFELAAYFFIYEALAHTQRELGRDAEGLEAVERHVSGQELL